MHYFKEGQGIRIRHNYSLDGKLAQSYGRSYILSFDGAVISEGEPSLALPELIEGMYEVILTPENIEELLLLPDKTYDLVFLGFTDELLTERFNSGNYQFSIIPQASNIVYEVSGTLTDLISNVRGKLGSDINDLLTDGNIENFLIQALNRHDDTYWNFDEVPAREIPAIENLATITALKRYIGEFAGSGTLEIMGLAGKVKENSGEVIKSLIAYSNLLKKEYDDDCIRMGIGQYKIQQSFKVKLNRETRGASPRQLSVNPPRVKLYGEIITEVNLNWERAIIPDFGSYRIYRDGVLIHTIYDNLITEYTEDIPTEGISFNYILEVVNRDGLTSTSNELTLTVLT